MQLLERDVGSILPLANNCGNIHVRFSTFFILENVRKIKKTLKNVKKRDTNKKRKKRFFYICDLRIVAYWSMHAVECVCGGNRAECAVVWWGSRVNWKKMSRALPSPAVAGRTSREYGRNAAPFVPDDVLYLNSSSCKYRRIRRQLLSGAKTCSELTHVDCILHLLGSLHSFLYGCAATPVHLPGTVVHLTYATLLTPVISGNDSEMYCLIVHTTNFSLLYGAPRPFVQRRRRNSMLNSNLNLMETNIMVELMQAGIIHVLHFHIHFNAHGRNRNRTGMDGNKDEIWEDGWDDRITCRSVIYSFVVSLIQMIIGVNFYKAARLEHPPLFKVQGFPAFEPPLFVRCKFCNAYYKAVLHSVTNNKITLNDIHSNEIIRLSVVLSLCPHGYPRIEEQHVYEIHQILFACYLWLWLSIPSFGGIGYVLPAVSCFSCT